MKYVLAFVIALAAAVIGSWTVRAQPAGDPLLDITSSVVYDVRPDEGGVYVTWDVHIVDNDPETILLDEGYVYYYISYGVPVLRGAEDVSGRSGSGNALAVTVATVEESDIVERANVTFDTELYYGNSYDFTLSYRVASARFEDYVINEHYAYFPAIGAGDASTVTVTAPDTAGWDASVQPVECDARGDGQFECDAADYPRTAAFAEVIRVGSLLTLNGSTQTQDKVLSLAIRYFPEEEAWAEHVRDLTARALPVLEELFGVPFPGPSVVDVEARGQRDLLGYGGLFNCQSSSNCDIGLSLAGGDNVLIHELAHFWTQNFNERWLTEGFAEFMSRRAADELGMDIEYSDGLEDPDLSLQLDDWDRYLLPTSASLEQRQLESYGYQRSRQFVELLEETVGLAALQAANHEGGDEEDIDSKKYFDLIEDASGQNLEAEFREWVFTPADSALLDERRAARDRYKALQGQIEDSGLDLPNGLKLLMDQWNFSAATAVMGRAEHAIYAYRAAEAAVGEPKSPLERFGLRGRDADTRLEEAGRLFRQEKYEESIEKSAEAKNIVDDAVRVAVYRLSVFVSGLLIGAVVIAFAILYRRRTFVRPADGPSI